MTEKDLQIQELKAQNRKLLAEIEKSRENAGDLISRSQAVHILESQKKGFEDCVSNKEVQLNKEWNKAVDMCIEKISGEKEN